jgi:hypothetical protein
MSADASISIEDRGATLILPTIALLQVSKGQSQAFVGVHGR